MTPSTPKPAAPPESAAEASNLLAELRGGSGGTTGSEIPIAAPRMKRPRTANIVIGVVIVASIGVIYGMRLHGMGLGMTLALDKMPIIDYDLERRQGNDKDQARILKQLKNLEPVQNEHESIAKNPFRLTESQPTEVAPIRNPVDPDAARKVQEAMQQTAFGTLELQAVMNGRIPIAKVNNRIVKVGDKIKVNEVEFTVKGIHDRTVELDLDGKLYALSMHDPAGNP